MLRSGIWAAKFVLEVDRSVRAKFRLDAPADQLSSTFTSQRLVDEFVANLGDDEAKGLMVDLSRWRDNNVRRYLREARRWRLEQVPVDLVDIHEAEGDLKPLWHELKSSLVAIASDRRLLKHERYRSLPADKPVAYAELLTVPTGVRYFVFDGVHRAVQLVRGGEIQLSLCVGR